MLKLQDPPCMMHCISATKQLRLSFLNFATQHVVYVTFYNTYVHAAN